MSNPTDPSRDTTQPNPEWAAHCTLWVPSEDAVSPQGAQGLNAAAADPDWQMLTSVSCSTNADHTGIRTSLDQLRLPWASTSSAA